MDTIGYVILRPGKRPRFYDTLPDAAQHWKGVLRAVVPLSDEDYKRANKLHNGTA